MKVALGLRAHSGWAALVVLGRRGDEIVVVDRRRLELVEERWQRQPYHAAERLPAAAARQRVERGIEAARAGACRGLRDAVARERERGNDVAACGVPVTDPMPEWSVDEILAVHFRMHKAEGVLFRDVLLQAARTCGIRPVPVPEKALTAHADRTRIAGLGRALGPPWGKDQKDAALAAAIALRKR